jgi:hypothetical protein
MGAHNLEAVIASPLLAQTYQVQHYWRLTDPVDSPWQKGAVITQAATGPGAICQRRDNQSIHGNFEVLVPEAGGLAHYWFDNSVNGPRDWNRVPGYAMPGAISPGSILENRVTANLELAVVVADSLVHRRFSRADWTTVATISSRASGAPVLIQSDYDNHLEVIVTEGANLVLYWFDGSAWRPGGVVAAAGSGPFGFVQGAFGNPPNHNFEVVIPRGTTLEHHWRDNSQNGLPWLPGGNATWGAGPVEAAAICSSDLRANDLQVLTHEGTSIYHLYRYSMPGGFRWMRSACIRLDDRTPGDVDPDRPRSAKLAQITGDHDLQHGGPTLSSLWPAGIHGTDLGVTVEHLGRTFLLFGDTVWDNSGWMTLDSIAEVTELAANLPAVKFHGAPRQVVGVPAGETISEVNYDVPLDAFSLNGQFFVFFSSNRFQDGKVMGRSILTRSLNPSPVIDPNDRANRLQFQFLTAFSDYRFINVSVQMRPASTLPGLPGVPGRASGGEVLLLWGSGAYRADDLRLAVVDLRDPATLNLLLGRSAFAEASLRVYYFAGTSGVATEWSASETDAVPLLWPGALGELSVRWVPEINRYLLMAIAGSIDNGPSDPIGSSAFVRTAPNPWGPWSRRRQVFDWFLDGMGLRNGQFIHNAQAKPPDTVGQYLFSPQGDGSGAGYAPYLHQVRTTPAGVALRYTMSTWNPYQTMLMEHNISSVELRALG